MPSDIKQAFDKAFAGQIKSAVVADLMRQQWRSGGAGGRAIERLLQQRKKARRVSDRTIRVARRRGRP